MDPVHSDDKPLWLMAWPTCNCDNSVSGTERLLHGANRALDALRSIHAPGCSMRVQGSECAVPTFLVGLCVASANPSWQASEALG